MRRAWVLVVLAALGCPDKDTDDTVDPGSDSLGTDTDADTAAVERCDSGLDDDGDGFADCADSDCDVACADAECLAEVLVLPVSREVTSNADLTTNSSRGNDCDPRAVPHDRVLIELAEDDAVFVTIRGDGEVVPVDACESMGTCGTAIGTGTVFYPDASGAQAFAVYPDDATSFGYDLERVPWEDCGNRVDDNGDGVVDCDDGRACSESPLCDDVCPLPTASPAVVSTTDVAAEWDDTSQVIEGDTCQIATVGSSDVVVTVTAVVGQTIRVEPVSETDAVLNILQGEGACSARAADGLCVASGSGESLEYTVVDDDTYYVVVSVGPSESAIALELSVSVVDPEECSTLVDEDEDGLAACDDPDCTGMGECALVCDVPPLPVVMSGTSWLADIAQETSFSAGDGCLEELGGDIRFSVTPLAGETLRIIEQGAAQTVVNITEGDGECSALLSGNVCSDSQSESNNEALTVFDVLLADDATRHVHVSAADASDDRAYDLRAGLVGVGECGLQIGAGATEESFRMSGTAFQTDWPNDVPESVGPGCFDPPSGVSDAAFTVSLAHGDTVIVQDVTSAGGIDHVVNILDGPCAVATSCVYGRDTPIGPGLPEIFSFTREDPGSTDIKTYTVQVTTAAAVDEPYDFTVSVLRD